jgi:hypothetical protein
MEPMNVKQLREFVMIKIADSSLEPDSPLCYLNIDNNIYPIETFFPSTTMKIATFIPGETPLTVHETLVALGRLEENVLLFVEMLWPGKQQTEYFGVLDAVVPFHRMKVLALSPREREAVIRSVGGNVECN